MTSQYVSIEQARRAREKKAKAPAPAETDDKRPVIRVGPSNMEEVVDAIEAALIASKRGIFQRDGKIVAPGEVKVISIDQHEVAIQRIFERGEHALLEDVGVAARFTKWDARALDFKPTETPIKAVRVLRERTHLRLPVLSGITSAPTLRADGSVLDKPGYDSTTGLLYEPGDTVFPKIPAVPSRTDAEAALRLLKGLLATFPYVDAASRSVALSAIVTAVVRRELPTAPAHVFSATVAGSGKTFLNQIPSIIATGRLSGLIAQGQNEEESEKRLGASFRFGDPIIIIDNCTAPLGGDFLCAAMTSPRVKVRILGKSEAPDLSSNAFIMANGNNLALRGDMCRRAVTCRLDPKVERPEERAFDRNPLDVARENRADYVTAAITILKAYITAGRPHQTTPLGSFEAWSRLVRDSLVWLGEADPVETMKEARQRDPEILQLEAVMTEWYAAFKDEKVTCQEVVTRATQKNVSFGGEPPEFKHPAFREALLAVAGRGGAINTSVLGAWLGIHERRMLSSATGEDADDLDDAFERAPKTHMFVRHGVIKGKLNWRLQTEVKTSVDDPVF